LEAKKAEANNAVSVIEAFEFLVGHYDASWRQSADKEYMARKLNAWMSSMEGISKDQIDYGKRKISMAECYLDFPPNAGQFRKLCQMMPKPCYVAPVSLQIAYDESPEAVADRVSKREEARASIKNVINGLGTTTESLSSLTQNNQETSKMYIDPKKKADELLKFDNYMKSKGIKPVGISDKINENIPSQNNTGETIDEPQYSKAG
jgi:hypothetical protein